MQRASFGPRTVVSPYDKEERSGSFPGPCNRRHLPRAGLPPPEALPGRHDRQAPLPGGVATAGLRRLEASRLSDEGTT